MQTTYEFEGVQRKTLKGAKALLERCFENASGVAHIPTYFANGKEVPEHFLLAVNGKPAARLEISNKYSVRFGMIKVISSQLSHI